MEDIKTKEEYFEFVADKYDASVDDIYRIYYGEEKLLDESLRAKVHEEFVSVADNIFIAMIWKGEVFPGTVNNIDSYLWIGQVMEGLNLQLYKTPYSVQLFPCNKIIADYDYFKYLLSKRPDAGFLIVTADEIDGLLQVCADYNRPYIFLNPPDSIDLNEYYLIRVDDEGFIKKGVSYLHGLGHHRIAFIQGWQAHKAATVRLDGYYQGLEAAGLDANPDFIVAGNWREDGGYDAAKELLQCKPRPTAIIASNDSMAIGAMKAIKEAGLSIPDDISLMGVDDIASAIQTDPPLTTVHIPMTQIGHTAAQQLISFIEGDPIDTGHYYLPTKLVVRGTTGPAPQ